MKTFVLDTNVLLHNPNALFSFQKNRVVIPISVIEELDTFKRGRDEKNRNARIFSRHLDEIRRRGKISEGVTLESGGIVQVQMKCSTELPPGLSLGTMDNRILLYAQQAMRDYGSAIFVSKDLNARIKSDAMGIPSEDFETNKVDIDELYQGWRKLTVNSELLINFDKEGLTPEELSLEGRPLRANEFLLLEVEGEETLLGRFNMEAGKILPLEFGGGEPWGIRALNPQQAAALDVLLDPAIQLVTLVGQAGTGKTLLALAAALQNTIDDRQYRRVLVSRPIIPLGRDIGFLPGTKDEKLHLWMQPIFDNLEFIFDRYLGGEVKAEDQLAFLLESKKIELEAMTFIRGRSVPGQFLIVDETQNMTPHEVKTIITRAGEGTKVVLTGDPYQIDHPYLDTQSNGLAYVVERFKGVPVYGHVSLVSSERSGLASLAVKLL
jgi:PhoH-like ATPase